MNQTIEFPKFFLEKWKNIDEYLKSFLYEDDNTEEHFTNFMQLISNYQILENLTDLKILLFMIRSISNNFYRKLHFFSKIEKIIFFLKKKIQQYYSNIEIFLIFKSNKRILLFLFDQKIVILDYQMINFFFQEKFIKSNHILYFFPEIKNFIINNFNFEDKEFNLNDMSYQMFLQHRNIGENENTVCQLIRKDSINEFIAFVNKEHISLSSQIPLSIFETNSFLLKNNPNLIEYSAFFGSFQIFIYLVKNGAEITPNIWKYSIHGRNCKIIDFLEKNNIIPINGSYLNCVFESIICHNHHIAQYIFNKYLKNSISDIDDFNDIFKKQCLKYFNFESLRSDFTISLDSLFAYINVDHQMQLFNTNNIVEMTNEKLLLFDLMKSLYSTVISLQNINQRQNEIIDNLNDKIDILQIQNEELKNKNKYLNLRKANLEKKIQTVNKQLKLVIGKVKSSNGKLKDLYQHVQELSIIQKNESDEEINEPETLANSLIQEIFKNSKINGFSRKYSRALKDICFMLYINSNITYKLLRNFLPLPHPDNLRKEYHMMINNKKVNLGNKNQIKYLLEELKGEMSKEQNEPIPAVLAFDAATIDPRNQGSNGLFVFNYQPLDGLSPTKIINIATKDNGRVDDEILDRIKYIENAGKAVNIIFRFVVSDSDPKTNILHKNFSDYIKKFQGNDFNERLKYIDNYPEMIPISDWLHLCKNLRARFAGHKILLSQNAKVIDPKSICELLRLDVKIMTVTGRESMRDDLAMQLINFENLQKLGEYEEYCCLVFLLPFVLFTDVLQSTNLSVEARKKLCFISYEIIKLLSNESKEIQTVKSKNSNIVGYLRNQMLLRTQNTILGFAYALEYYGNNLMTSRLGTHIVEFIFGHMRNGCNGYDVLDKCTFQIAKSQITKEILEKYGKNEPLIAGRSHPGGACFSEKWNIAIADDIEIEKVAIECIQLIHEQLNYHDSNIVKLVTFLSENAPTKVPKTRETLSCVKIQARQIHYSNKK